MLTANLKIMRRSDRQWHSEYQCNQPEITLGRDPDNLITLEDSNKLISRKHLIITRYNDQFQLMDCQSRNGTRLNDVRIESGKPYSLKDGDRIDVGEYTIVIMFKKSERTVPETGDETVVTLNPFLPEATELSQVLKRMVEKYRSLDVPNKDSALQQVMMRAVQTTGAAEISYLWGEALLPEKQDINGSVPTGKLAATDAPDLPSGGFFGEALQILMEAVLGLARGIANFRANFCGFTEVRTPTTLHAMKLDDLKRYLFDQELSGEEINNRLANIRSQIDTALLHPLALLDGYRTSIREGVREILLQISPEKLEQPFAQKYFQIGPFRIPYRWIPFYVKYKTYETMRRELAMFAREGTGYFEMKLFRPHFINAYMNAISVARYGESPEGDSDTSDG